MTIVVASDLLGHGLYVNDGDVHGLALQMLNGVADPIVTRPDGTYFQRVVYSSGYSSEATFVATDEVPVGRSYELHSLVVLNAADQSVLTMDGMSYHFNTVFQFLFSEDIFAGNDQITGNRFDDEIHASTGNDLVYGNEGNDTLDGGAGNNTLYGGAGDDEFSSDVWTNNGYRIANDGFYGGDGQDQVEVLSRRHGLTINLSLATAQVTGDGTDTFSSIEDLYVEGRNDTLTGSNAANWIRSGVGEDRVFGLGGADELDGGAGADKLFGGDGRDTLKGGTGTDTMTGGLGRDAFYFYDVRESNGSTSRDRVTDFTHGVDDIDLHRIDANGPDNHLYQAFTFSKSSPRAHSVWFTQDAQGILVKADVTGDQKPDFILRLLGVDEFSRGDLILTW